MTITTKDLARIAKVSQSTVSRCLNDSPLVSDKTKSKVMKIAKDYNFQFNANARSLSTKKTNTVAIIVPTNLDNDWFDMHFRTWQDSLMKGLESLDLDVIISFYKNKHTDENNIRKLITSGKIDGLINLQPEMDEDTFNLLSSSNIAYIFCKYIPLICKAKNIDYAYVDQFKGGYLAGNYLVNLGHRNIITLSATLKGDEFIQRTDGFKSALKDYNIPFTDSNIYYGDGSYKYGYDFIKNNLLSIKSKEITAIFAQTDLMALGAINCLKDLAIKVPDDISIIGFDDIELGTYYKPNLSTISQPTKDIAMLTCKRLNELLNNTDVSLKHKLAIEPILVQRESTTYR